MTLEVQKDLIDLINFVNQHFYIDFNASQNLHFTEMYIEWKKFK
jgi:hypothetical protein